VENGYIESFNGRLRDECLNEHWFMNMAHARSVIERWRLEYNTERPHSALGYLTPAQYAAANGEALALRASAEEETIEISLTEDSIPSRG
jgi:transposase InsO family protein